MAVVEVLIWITAVFLAILIHELGHAAVMRAFGFLPSITLYGFGGLASYNAGGIYGHRGPGPWGEVLISAAGPGAGFMLAAIIAGSVWLGGHPILVGWFGFLPVVFVADVGSWAITELLNSMLYICIFWGYINLLPVYPLDGGKIAREILVEINTHQGIGRSLMLSAVTAAVVAVVGLVQFREPLIAFFFGYMAYTSYATLQAYGGRGRW
jgi:Zn-dependent protease